VPGRGVLDAFLVDGGALAERETEGVVVDQGEGQGCFLLGQAGCLQWRQECLSQGKGVRPEGVAGLEQPGDAGMVVQDSPQPVVRAGSRTGTKPLAGPLQLAWGA
jgi:hypothetical protein